MKSRLMGTCAAVLLSILYAASPLASGSVAKDKGLNLIPWPKQIDLGDNPLTLTGASRIVVLDPSLTPLAEILSGEIWQLTGLKLATASAPPAAGDIVLKIDPSLSADADILTTRDQKFLRVRDYAHTFNVTDRI